MQIGIVGLGRMGANMARRLMRKQYKVVVYDLQKESVAALVKEGAAGAIDFADLAQKLAKVIQDILAAQQTDGGWSLAVLGRAEDGSAKWGSQGSYPADSISDGYATGLAVLTLSRVKAPASNASMAT